MPTSDVLACLGLEQYTNVLLIGERLGWNLEEISNDFERTFSVEVNGQLMFLINFQ